MGLAGYGVGQVLTCRLSFVTRVAGQDLPYIYETAMRMMNETDAVTAGTLTKRTLIPWLIAAAVLGVWGWRVASAQQRPSQGVATMPAAEKTIENVIPVLAVSDVNASMQWYESKLGFKTEWGGEPKSAIGSISRDGRSIMLQKRTPAGPSTVWIGCDIASVYKQCMDAGLPFVQRPTNQAWALEMRIADPNGNILWFGGEPLKDVPSGQVPEAFREAKK
jgi:hypothetical protein